MKRRQKVIRWLLILVPLGVLLVAACLYLLVQLNTLSGRLGVIVVDELQRRYGHEVHIGKVTTKPLGTAVIEDFAIAEKKKLSQGTLLKADEIVVKYDWMSLITKRNAPVQAVRSVTLISPTAHIVRYLNGKWNFADFLVRPAGPPRPPFNGKLIVSNGKITLSDYLSKAPGSRPAVNRMTNVEATMDASGAPILAFRIQAKGVRGRLGDITLQGTVDTKASVWDFDGAATDAAAAYWTNYLSRPSAVAVRQGLFDTSFSLTYRKTGGKAKWDYAGSADLRKATLALVGFKKPATDVRGRIRFTTNVAAVDASARFAGSSLRVKGSIMDFAKPKLNLKVNTPSADYRTIVGSVAQLPSVGGMRLSGRGPLTLQISGAASDPRIAVEGRVPQVAFYGREAADVAVSALYAQHTVQLRSVKGSALGGTVELSGAVGLSRPTRLSITGRVRNVDLADLPVVSGMKLTGSASGRFTILGTTTAPAVTASVEVPRGNFNNVAFTAAQARLSVSGKTVHIDRMRLHAGGGDIALSGDETPGKLDLSVSAQGVDLKQAGKLVGQPDVSGTLFFRGNVTGSPEKPVATGSAEIFNARWQNYAVDYARGRLSATTSGVHLDEAIVRILPGEAVVQGEIAKPAGRPLEMNLDVQVQRAQAGEVLKMIGAELDVQGTLGGDLHVTGAGSALSATGSIHLDDGAVSGIPVSSASADINYSDGALRISKASMETDGATIDASGSVEMQGKLDLELVAKNIAMARLNPYIRPYAEITGNISELKASVSGTAESPNIQLAAQADQPSINGLQFNKLRLQAGWSDDTLSVKSLQLGKGDTIYVIDSASYNMDDGKISARGELTNVPLEPLVEAINRSDYLKSGEGETYGNLLARIPKPFSGSASVKFEASGPMDALDGTVKGSLAALKLGPVAVNNVDANLKLDKGALVVEDFSATSKDLNIAIRPGVVYSKGSLNVDMTASNVDAALLAPYIRPVGVSGTATIDALITGTPATRVVTASVEMENPIISGVQFDRFRASRITVAGDKVEASDVILSKGPHQMVLHGSLPWDWSKFNVPADQPVDFHAELRDQSLALLNVLTSEVRAEGTKGVVNGSLSVTGTFSKPQTSGSLSVKDGQIAFRNTDATLNDIQASVVFNGERVIVQNLTAASSLGGTLSMEPGGFASLQDFPNGPVEMALIADKLRLKETNLAGYDETVSATLDSRLSIGGTLKSPAITGRIDADHAVAAVPPVLKTVEFPERTYPINPSFDIRVVLGQDVWFRNPRVSALTQGEIGIEGTLEKPVLKGRMTVADGYIRLPTARLRLVKGGTVDFSYNKTDGVRTVLNVEARTSLAALSPLNVRRQYQITVTARGPLDDMDVRLRSSPPDLSNERILALLGHVDDFFTPGDVALKQDLGQVFTAFAGGAALQPIEDVLSQTFGLQDLRVEFGPGEPFAVYVSRQLLPKFSVSYWQSLNAINENYFVRFSYDISDSYAASYTTNEQRIGTLEANFIYRF